MLFLPAGSFIYGHAGLVFSGHYINLSISVPILRAITLNGVILASYFLIFIVLKENNFASRVLAVF
jgi:hypothetical protein